MNKSEVFVRQESELRHGQQRIKLYAGSKRLTADFYKDGWIYDAITNIDTNEEEDRIPGETTAVYSKLHEILRELADVSGKTILHSFRTGNKRLQTWVFAEGKGKDLMNDAHIWWEQNGTWLKCYKHFIPKEKT